MPHCLWWRQRWWSHEHILIPFNRLLHHASHHFFHHSFKLRLFDLVQINEGLPHRGYSWYRCFRHWGSLRFDDTSGLDPSSLERRARGVFELLKKMDVTDGTTVRDSS